jgi:hypothetical protein
MIFGRSSNAADQELVALLTARDRELLQRWPHLRVAGRGQANRIAGTFYRALAQARRQQPPAGLVARLRALVLRRPRKWIPILAAILAEATETTVTRRMGIPCVDREWTQ